MRVCTLLELPVPDPSTALAAGLANYQDGLPFHGVIGNRVGSAGHAEMLKASLKPPLNWLGRIEEDDAGGLDLKHQGTALMVDAARILGLSQGITSTSTRERLLGAGRAR